MVIQILSRVMEKLAQAGETVTGADDLQNIVQSIVAGTKEPLPGLLVLTQEHGEKCHELLENPKIREKYNTSCALLQENQVSMDGIEAVVLFNLTTDAMCKLASGITDTPYTKLAAQALLMGKKLYVPREEVELYRYPTGGLGSYQCMMQAKLTKLVAFGLKICPMAELEDVLLGKEAEVTADAVSEAVVKAAAPWEENAGETSCDPKPEAEKPCEKACEPASKEEAPKEITFTKKVISERDIIEANREGVKVIRISERNILTALAKDAASARNIQLIRE
mgnify:FL=1